MSHSVLCRQSARFIRGVCPRRQKERNHVTMKLNYKRTVFVGFAFFLILAFWQAYDSIIPKILNDKFGMSQTWSGIVMAIDNILALFMLPLFGNLSDKTKSKYGRRTPYIVLGTVVAAAAFVLLSFADNMQLTNIKDVSEIDSESALSVLYDNEYGADVKTPDGEKFEIRELFTKEEFVKIRSTDRYIKGDDGKYTLTDAEKEDSVSLYTEYVVPLRQAYAWQMTAENPVTLVFFMVLLLIALVAMATFRSPAVALMPDVTIKPLRSKGNAVINLMGSFGGIAVLVLGLVFGTGSTANALMSYMAFFAVVAGIMIVALFVFLLTVNEPKFVLEMEADSRRFGIDESEEEGPVSAGGKLSRSELCSLLLILASVVLWYFGYNAVTTKYSVYAGEVLNLDYNMTLIIAQGAAILSYIPVGMLSSRFGRKKMILTGVLMLAAAFGAAAFMREGSPALFMNIIFILAGIGWATINVNSFPMVVELSKNSDVGKYTGFYYTASMAAQTITPVLSGIFLDIKMTTLFPYATIFVVLSFITMLFVRHGDSKPEAVKSKLEAFAEVD